MKIIGNHNSPPKNNHPSIYYNKIKISYGYNKIPHHKLIYNKNNNPLTDHIPSKYKNNKNSNNSMISSAYNNPNKISSNYHKSHNYPPSNNKMFRNPSTPWTTPEYPSAHKPLNLYSNYKKYKIESTNYNTSIFSTNTANSATPAKINYSQSWSTNTNTHPNPPTTKTHNNPPSPQNTPPAIPKTN